MELLAEDRRAVELLAGVLLAVDLLGVLLGVLLAVDLAGVELLDGLGAAVDLQVWEIRSVCGMT